jgi:hypothetical protein
METQQVSTGGHGRQRLLGWSLSPTASRAGAVLDWARHDVGSMYLCIARMKRLLPVALLAAATVAGSSSLACEKHLNSQPSTSSLQTNSPLQSNSSQSTYAAPKAQGKEK